MSDSRATTLELSDGEVLFHPHLFAHDADRLFAELLESTAWRQENIKLYGRAIPLPRLTAWYGDAGTGYKYSGLTNIPAPWTPVLVEVKAAVEQAAGTTFNSVLLNRYRTGQDSVAWHSDDEIEFGENPAIASVSFGAARRFQFRHKLRKDLRAEIELTHGSLLLMRGATQHHWMPRFQKPKSRSGSGSI